MNRCWICCEPLPTEAQRYHTACARRLFGAAQPPQLDYDWSDLNRLAGQVVRRSIAVPGVQPKLSLHLERRRGAPGRLTIVEMAGHFILKPPVPEYPDMPENEHAVMRMAGLFGIRTAPCGLIALRGGERAYLTRRLDRLGDTKLHMEDMAQLTDKQTEQKYRGSMEQVGRALLRWSAQPLLDAQFLFELILYAFLTGNSDMHLKNFSLLHAQDGRVTLAPAYDLLSVRLALPADREELALTLNGKKHGLKRRDFDAFAARLGLESAQIAAGHARLAQALPAAIRFIPRSFLKPAPAKALMDLMRARADRLEWAQREK